MNQELDLLTMLALDVEKETVEDAMMAKDKYATIQSYFSESRPKLKKKPHVVIVGGGIISLMSALYLDEVGFDISIIEQKSLGAAASGRNGGAVMMMGRELTEVPFARSSINLWETLEKKGIKTHFARKGHLMIARNKIEIEKLEQAFELYRKADIPVKLMDNNEMRNYSPHIGNHIQLGLFSFEDAQSYPFTTINGLIELLKSKGVNIYPYTKAIAFETNNRSIQGVVTDQKTIKGDYFLISAGPWSSNLCELLNEHVKIKPRRSQIMVTEVVRQRIIEPFFTGNGIYLRQTHAGNILFGGGGSWEVDGYDVHNTSHAIQLLTERFIEIFPAYKTKQLIRGFAGTVEITPDHLPAFGPLLNWDNGFVSAGYNGHGFGVSAVMGKLMSSNLYDRVTDKLLDNSIKSVLEPMKINRFNTFSKV